MDSLVLTRVVGALDGALSRAAFRDLRSEVAHGFRLVFEREGRPLSVRISLVPELPWIGRPLGRERRPPAASPGPFGAHCRRALAGHLLSGVVRPGGDRSVCFRFADGQGLVAELGRHGANLILLDPAGRVVMAARRPRSAQARLVIGKNYAARPLPPGRLDPFRADAAEIDRVIRERTDPTGSPVDALSRAVLGLERASCEQVMQESRLTGESPGAVLRRRLACLAAGEIDPVVEAPWDPSEAATAGRLDPATCRLLPWEPDTPANPPRQRFRLEDPAATATLYHDSLERARGQLDRASALRTILEREIRRSRTAGLATRGDLASFEDPQRYRLWGEALLAGLTTARTHGNHALVSNPYDAEGGELCIPVRPGRGLQEEAERYFKLHRRAKRGLEHAQARLAEVEARLDRLNRLQEEHAGAAAAEPIAALERAMRGESIPVGLEPASRAARDRARTVPPRLEGVRLVTGAEGRMILVGKTGKDNHRLTFKLAGPEDFWFHALGVPGAHVVLRNEDRERRPPPSVLLEAAAVAAWYSDARKQAMADVQWTRRKYVRRIRGARPGTVTLKKFETVTVRPGLPAPAG